MKKNPFFAIRNIYGKHILIPTHSNDASNEPILLNDVAYEIWASATEGLSSQEMVIKVAENYCLTSDSAEYRALEHFTNQMISMGLLSEEE